MDKTKKPWIPKLEWIDIYAFELEDLLEILYEDLFLAFNRGVFGFCKYYGVPSYVIKDKLGKIAQIRRIDGKEWNIPKRKKTINLILKNSDTTIPIGFCDNINHNNIIIMSQNSDDFLASFSLIRNSACSAVYPSDYNKLPPIRHYLENDLIFNKDREINDFINKFIPMVVANIEYNINLKCLNLLKNKNIIICSKNLTFKNKILKQLLPYTNNISYFNFTASEKYLNCRIENLYDLFYFNKIKKGKKIFFIENIFNFYLKQKQQKAEKR